MRADLRVRITAVTLASALALLVLFGSSAWIVFRQLQGNTREIEEAYREVFQANLGESAPFDASYVSHRAAQVAGEVTTYLKHRYGSLSAVPPSSALERDDGLRKVALQWVTDEPPPGAAIEDADQLRVGYTVVYARDFTMTTHTQERLIGRNVRSLSEQADLYLFWWDIFGGAVLENTEKAGYYLWPEADGSVSIKYMVCAPIPDTELMIAATVYPEITNKDVIVASARSVARTLFEIDRSARDQIVFILAGAVGIVALAVIAILVLTRREAQRVSRDRDRLEKYWSLARIDHLVRSFSHGIRNDLFIIRNRVRALERGLPQLPDEKELALCTRALGKILQRADRIQHQVDHAVADKRADAEKGVFDAADVVRAVALREIEAEGPDGTAIEILGEPGDARVEGMEDEFALAVENLVLNARQAMSGRGALRIELRNRVHEGIRWLSVVFRDTGPGFERPEKATALGWTTRSDAGGTGTGLAIVERVVLQYGGDLRVGNSKEEEWGAEVEMRLPLAYPAPGWLRRIWPFGGNWKESLPASVGR